MISLVLIVSVFIFFFFKDTATTEIYTYCHTLSLHDALPICLAFTARKACASCHWPRPSATPSMPAISPPPRRAAPRRSRQPRSRRGLRSHPRPHHPRRWKAFANDRQVRSEEHTSELQ